VGVTAITPIRIAIAAALLAFVSEPLPVGLALYLTILALAGLTGAAFLGYVAAADDPRPAALYDAAVCAVTASLLLADVALRFPDVVAGSAPGAAAVLDRVALGLVLAAAVAPWLAQAGLRERVRGQGRALARAIRA
jgi:hypothetical protein